MSDLTPPSGTPADEPTQAMDLGDADGPSVSGDPAADATVVSGDSGLSPGAGGATAMPPGDADGETPVDDEGDGAARGWMIGGLVALILLLGAILVFVTTRGSESPTGTSATTGPPATTGPGPSSTTSSVPTSTTSTSTTRPASTSSASSSSSSTSSSSTSSSTSSSSSSTSSSSSSSSTSSTTPSG